jgi:hypothetical protein
VPTIKARNLLHFFLKNIKPKSAEEYKVYTFEFDDTTLTDDETLVGSFVLFEELGYTELFHVNPEVSACAHFLLVARSELDIYSHADVHEVACFVTLTFTKAHVQRLFISVIV